MHYFRGVHKKYIFFKITLLPSLVERSVLRNSVVQQYILVKFAVNQVIFYHSYSTQDKAGKETY